MLLKKLEIDNFKGIGSAEIELDPHKPGNIVTLIGLNESGKTTVLEAFSNFVSVDEETSSIVQTVAAEQRPIDLIPKSKKSNFTGEISIRAHLTLDDDDVDALASYLRRRLGVHLVKADCPKSLTARKVLKFVDSDLQKTETRWIFAPKFRRKTGTVIHTADARGKTSDVWNAATHFCGTRFPKILYFPTFLFNVPEKIYLEDIDDFYSDEERVINRYFRQVLQDVADSLGDGVDIEKHIVQRVARQRDKFENPLEFLAAFFGLDEATQIRAVVNRLSGAITKTVFGAWNEIFEHGVSDKSVRIEWGVDAEKNNTPYLQLYIYDGEQSYSVHERSLGFRWFFTFLLFTQFRKSRRGERSTIFLFDEPASNLHARAQMKLLESFGKTAVEDQFIIYSTHSHYMIEPMWLEKAFIVENKGIDFEGEEAGARFESRDTDIRLTRYRDFVGQYPERVSYFQPALDSLRFNFGPLVPGKHALVVEGKYDFHPLTYFKERLGLFKDISIFPAPSANEAGTFISLLRGLGSKFVVLLDDDVEGNRSAVRYREHHLLMEDQVMTLSDLDRGLKGKAFEALYSKQVNVLAGGSERRAKKAEYSHLFQRLTVEKNHRVGLGNTTVRIKAMMEKIEASIKDLPEPKPKPSPRKRKSRAKKQG